MLKAGESRRGLDQKCSEDGHKQTDVTYFGDSANRACWWMGCGGTEGHESDMTPGHLGDHLLRQSWLQTKQVWGKESRLYLEDIAKCKICVNVIGRHAITLFPCSLHSLTYSVYIAFYTAFQSEISIITFYVNKRSPQMYQIRLVIFIFLQIQVIPFFHYIFTRKALTVD